MQHHVLVRQAFITLTVLAIPTVILAVRAVKIRAASAAVVVVQEPQDKTPQLSEAVMEVMA
jgi:hypothetical protein